LWAFSAEAFELPQERTKINKKSFLINGVL